MADQFAAGDPNDEVSGMAILVVPRALAQQVVSYVSSLVAEETEVAGYVTPRAGRLTLDEHNTMPTQKHGYDIGGTVTKRR